LLKYYNRMNPKKSLPQKLVIASKKTISYAE